MSYCQFVQGLNPDDHNPNKHYHDHVYGYSVASDNELFARLVLEINQAGLSWSTILNKWNHFYRAYADFDVFKVAAFDDADVERLLQDAGIIRNRLKINAAIYNAQQIVQLQQQSGSFKAWLDEHHPLSKDEWVKLFKKHFKFVGGEIVNEFLMSTGYLAGAHDDDCPILQQVLASQPPYANGGLQDG